MKYIKTLTHHISVTMACIVVACSILCCNQGSLQCNTFPNQSTNSNARHIFRQIELDGYRDSIIKEAGKGNLDKVHEFVKKIEKSNAYVTLNVNQLTSCLALQVATKNGHVPPTITAYFQQNKIDIWSLDCYDSSIIERIVEDGHLEALQYLRKLGFEISCATMASRAAMHGHTGILRYLKKEFHTLNIDQPFGEDLVSWAACSSRLALPKKLEVLNFLVNEGGIHLNRCTIIRGPCKKTNPAFVMTASAGNADVIDVLKHLRKLGCNTNETFYGMNALMYASKRGDLKTVSYLIEEVGMDVNAKSSFPGLRTYKHGGLIADKKTALMYAAASGKSEIVTYLLAHGAEINVQDTHNYTALMDAVHSRDVATINVLVQSGANPSLRNSNNKQTALDIAKTYKNPLIISLLKTPQARKIAYC